MVIDANVTINPLVKLLNFSVLEFPTKSDIIKHGMAILQTISSKLLYIHRKS